jgi:hypothetical protein
VPVKKASKKVRQPYALKVGATFATTLGNQTHTYVTDPKSGNEFTVTLIWEQQGRAGLAAPYIIQVTAGKSDQFNSANIERRLGLAESVKNYQISSTFMRRIPFERIIDESRKALIKNNSFFIENNIPLVHELKSSLLNSPKKQGRPFDRPDSFYRDIARYYNEAKSQGGSIARKPATYIRKFVASEVGHLAEANQLVQIRKWVAEARKRGYLAKYERN